MNKDIHDAILHLAKAVLCIMMLFLLFIMILFFLSYPILVFGIIILIAVIVGMTFVQLGSFVGYVIRGNRR